MHLSRLPSGAWRVAVRHNGQRRSATAATKGAAKRLGHEMELALGGTPSANPTATQSTSSGDKTEAGAPIENRSDSSDINDPPIALIAGLSGGGLVLLLVGLFLLIRLRRKPSPPPFHR